MITLYGFGPAFGLPDPSPFVTKVELLLKMSGRPFQTAEGSLRKAPKGKLPYIEDEGELISDSTLIRWHLERKYGLDFDSGLDARQRATAWAFEKMMEEHAYWAFLDVRWMDDRNFDRGPRRFFNAVPAPLRPFVVAMVRRTVRKRMKAQGFGQHTREEIEALGTRSVDAMAGLLGDQVYAMGSEPTGVDATLFAFSAGALCPHFESPLRSAAERHDNLKRYVARMAARYYPDFGHIAGIAPEA